MLPRHPNREFYAIEDTPTPESIATARQHALDECRLEGVDPLTHRMLRLEAIPIRSSTLAMNDRLDCHEVVHRSCERYGLLEVVRSLQMEALERRHEALAKMLAEFAEGK